MNLRWFPLLYTLADSLGGRRDRLRKSSSVQDLTQQAEVEQPRSSTCERNLMRRCNQSAPCDLRFITGRTVSRLDDIGRLAASGGGGDAVY